MHPNPNPMLYVKTYTSDALRLRKVKVQYNGDSTGRLQVIKC